MGTLEKILSTLTAAGLFIFVILNASNFGTAIKAASTGLSSYVSAIGTTR